MKYKLFHRQRITFTPIYDWKPLKNGNLFMKNLIGNWSVAGAYTYHSPEFATVQSNTDSNLNNDSAGDRTIINPAGSFHLGRGVTAYNAQGQKVAAGSAAAIACVVNNPCARFIILLLVAVLGAAQPQPNLAAQRTAMKKLEFLVGKWSGEVSVIRGPGDPLKLEQTENVQWKLGGLVLLVEGSGRGTDGQTAYQALATISFDEATNTYRFRAFHDGHYLDTELKVAPSGFAWGFSGGPMTIANTMTFSEKGEWVETTDVIMGSAAPQRTVEMRLRRQ